jgi:hypothetical protein
LRVADWIHTQLKLRLIWIPAGLADFDVVYLGLENLLAQLFELVSLTTPIAFSN